MQDEELEAPVAKPAKAAAKKPAATRSKRDDDDDDDDLEEEDDVSLDIDDEEDIEINDEDAYALDKDFEEFDLPKSKTKSPATGSVGKKKAADDLDDDFKDLGLDGLGRGGFDDDDDDDF